MSASPSPSNCIVPREAALAYLRRGWSVIPIAPGTKKSLIPWQDYQHRRPTEDEVRGWWSRWPDAQVAIVTGKVSGLVVLDQDGLDAEESLRDKHLPPTPTAWTGKDQGVHRYFLHPGFECRNFARRLPGLDFRGDGGYVLAPPSLHPSGRRYRWADTLSPDEVPLASCPGWLLDLLRPAPPAQSPELEGEPIPEGQRNATLASLAGTMRRRGMTAQEIEAALLAINRRCVPPLPEREVKAIARSVARYAPPEADPLAMQKDYGHALVLSTTFKGRFRWAAHRGSWTEYRIGVWRPVPEEYVCRVAADTLREHYAAELANTREEQEIKRLTQAIRETCVYARITGALAFLKGWDCILTMPDEWDRDAWLLNVANGTLDLRTGSLRPHDPADLLTKQAPVVYDPAATGPAWKTHLDIFLPNANVRRQVQRGLGLSLVGTVLEESLDIWYGVGANGKTTTARVLHAVLGDYAIRAAPDLLVESKHERHPTEIADLCGSRLVFSIEVDEGKKLAEALVKDLTGGDRKKARFMRRDFFEFNQTFRIVLIVNHKPAITGCDDAIWRRIRLIPWQVQVAPGNWRPQEEVVRELCSEGSAILNWLLEGLRDWQNDRHWIAPEVVAATQAYRKEEDRLAAFLSECCELGPHFTVGVGELYDAYTRWCEASCEEALGKRRFGEMLRRRGMTQQRVGSDRERTWVGLRLAATRTNADNGSVNR